VRRRHSPGGASPTRRIAPAESNRSSHGGNEMVEDRGPRIGDCASVLAATCVNAKQALKRSMRRPTRHPFRGRLIRQGQRARTPRRVLAAACTQGECTQHGKPHGVVRDDQPDAREGQAGRRGVAKAVIPPALIFSMVRRVSRRRQSDGWRGYNQPSRPASQSAGPTSKAPSKIRQSIKVLELTGIAHVPSMRHCANPWGRSGMAISAP
jgi:hypothetical protein